MLVLGYAHVSRNEADFVCMHANPDLLLENQSNREWRELVAAVRAGLKSSKQATVSPGFVQS